MTGCHGRPFSLYSRVTVACRRVRSFPRRPARDFLRDYLPRDFVDRLAGVLDAFRAVVLVFVERFALVVDFFLAAISVGSSTGVNSQCSSRHALAGNSRVLLAKLRTAPAVRSIHHP
jgi:hypothetical protein